MATPRPKYAEVVAREGDNGAALNNLGVYHLLRRESVRAIDFLATARDIEESAAASNYNLAKIYETLLEFSNASEAMNRAGDASRELTDQWRDAGETHVLLHGGRDRIPEIRRELRVERRGGESSCNYSTMHFPMSMLKMPSG